MCDQEEITKDRKMLLRSIYEVAKKERNPKYLSVWRSICQETNKFVADEPEIKNKVSFAQKPIPEYKYDIGRRILTTLGKYIRKNHKRVSVKLNDQELDKFVSKVIAQLTDINSQFKILRGEKLLEAYKNDHGVSTCMTGPSKTPYIMLYVENPKNVGLLVTPTARALIWKSDQGKTLIDRVYCSGYTDYELYRKYAKQNNCVLLDEHINKRNPKGFTVTLNKARNNQFPYCDILCHFCFKGKNKIVLYSKEPKKWDGFLDSTYGGFDND